MGEVLTEDELAQAEQLAADWSVDTGTLRNTIEELVAECRRLQNEVITQSTAEQERAKWEQMAEELAATLLATREELHKHGWGDFHYGSTGQARAVTEAVAKADDALANYNAMKKSERK